MRSRTRAANGEAARGPRMSCLTSGREAAPASSAESIKRQRGWLLPAPPMVRMAEPGRNLTCASTVGRPRSGSSSLFRYDSSSASEQCSIIVVPGGAAMNCPICCCRPVQLPVLAVGSRRELLSGLGAMRQETATMAAKSTAMTTKNGCQCRESRDLPDTK